MKFRMIRKLFVLSVQLRLALLLFTEHRQITSEFQIPLFIYFPKPFWRIFLHFTENLTWMGSHRPTRPWYTFKCASGLGNTVQSWK